MIKWAENQTNYAGLRVWVFPVVVESVIKDLKVN